MNLTDVENLAELAKLELSEDEKFAQEKRLQEITDEFIDKLDEAGEKKRQELLSI